MGAGASTQAGAAGGTTDLAAANDHYTVLQVDVTATQDEIKKAFRKVALKEHPDKNPNDIEGATKRFARVQAAYECLSDPQERAWYDDHREDIINGGGAGGGTTEAEASFFDAVRRGTQKPRERATPARGLQTPHLLKFFSTSAWSGFDDSPTGFFNTFATLFSLLAADETSWSSPHLYPSFGTSTTTDQADLRAFYQAWTNFATEKDFAWKDLYKVEEEMPRWHRREIEKENQRARQTARREYNDTVRSLVAFVRRRDPRYTNSSSSAARAAAEAEIRASLAAAARQRDAERAAAAASYQAQDWQEADAKAQAVYALWDEVSDEDGGAEQSGEEEVEEVVWCEACSKGYRSGGAWEDHERSRKHVKNVQRLIREMQLEDAELGLASESGPSTVPTPVHPGPEPESPIASTSRSPSPDPTSTRQTTDADAAHLADSLANYDFDSEEESDVPDAAAAAATATGARSKRSKKKKQQRKQAQAMPGFGELGDEDDEALIGISRGARDDVDLGDVVGMAPSGGKRKKGKGRQPFPPAPASDDPDDAALGRDESDPLRPGLASEEDDDRPSSRANGGKSAKRKPPRAEPAQAPGGLDVPDEDGVSEAGGAAAMSKKEKRRAKEAAKKVAAAGGGNCNVCGETFPSRSKLFQHINETGHALADGAAGTPAASAGGKGGRKKGKR